MFSLFDVTLGWLHASSRVDYRLMTLQLYRNLRCDYTKYVISTSNHMIMRVITEKSPVAYQTKFWNHRERSEGDFYILFDNQGWFFRNHPKIMLYLVNHMLSKDLFNTIVHTDASGRIDL